MLLMPSFHFYGQGMNCGFEDVRMLDELIDAHHGDWDKIFEEYSEQRKPDGDAILDLALQNFIEMRDLVGDPKIHPQKEDREKIKRSIRKYLPTFIFNGHFQQYQIF
jgi:kynurenine 3-monooxygenase